MSGNKTVLVGVGQVRNRAGLDTEEWEPREPAQLMTEALERAFLDAGLPKLANEADFVGVVPPLAWSYADAPAHLAALVGAAPNDTLLGSWGGESAVQLLNDVANRIEAGETRIALLAGAESMASRREARARGVELDWPPGGPSLGDLLRQNKAIASPLEMRHGIRMPIESYPLFEIALRAEAGRGVEEHQVYVSKLMARFSEAAADNPYSWFPGPRSAEEIREVSDENRWVCFPYPKLMNALMGVDQGAAVIAMSESEADRLGVPAERRVYYLGGAGAHDAWCPTERIDFVSSPAYEAAAAQTMQHAGIEVSDVELFDLYSCFPSAVELVLKALGLSTEDPRGPSQTGGLAHHGGPGNNYGMHSLANLMTRLRDGAGRVGWVSSLGMTATKHSIAALATDPERIKAAEGRSTQLTLPEELRTGPELVEAPDADGRIETYTVVFGRDARPSRSVIVVRLDDGRRTLANGRPEDYLTLLETEGVGLRGHVSAGSGDAPNGFALTS